MQFYRYSQSHRTRSICVASEGMNRVIILNVFRLPQTVADTVHTRRDSTRPSSWVVSGGVNWLAITRLERCSTVGQVRHVTSTAGHRSCWQRTTKETTMVLLQVSSRRSKLMRLRVEVFRWRSSAWTSPIGLSTCRAQQFPPTCTIFTLVLSQQHAPSEFRLH